MPRVRHCDRCRLHETRNKLVWGTGPIDADVKFVGEGPGKTEDEYGQPFIGRCGGFMRIVVKEIGGVDVFKYIFVTNIVMCRPPNNRDPYPDEIEACNKWLRYKLITHRPKVVCCFGRLAADHLIGSGVWEWNGVYRKHKSIYIPVYHPAYILRNRSKIEDFKTGIRRVLRKGDLHV